MPEVWKAGWRPRNHQHPRTRVWSEFRTVLTGASTGGGGDGKHATAKGSKGSYHSRNEGGREEMEVGLNFDWFGLLFGVRLFCILNKFGLVFVFLFLESRKQRVSLLCNIKRLALTIWCNIDVVMFPAHLFTMRWPQWQWRMISANEHASSRTMIRGTD
jgi:hypothetical protein